MNGGPADEKQLILVQIKEDGVADHVSVVIAPDKLLGLVDTVVLKTIDPRIGEQLDRVRSLNPHVRHVVGLVEKDAGLFPSALFLSPVRKLGRHHRIDIRAELRITHHLHRIAGALDRFI